MSNLISGAVDGERRVRVVRLSKDASVDELVDRAIREGKQKKGRTGVKPKLSPTAKPAVVAADDEMKAGRSSLRSSAIIGIDLGGNKSDYAVLGSENEILEQGRVATRDRELRVFLNQFAPTTVVIEVGMVSPWVSRLITSCGHRVIVANARRVGLIKGNKRKNNRVDALTLARLGKADEALLHPIRHRGEQAQADLAVLRARDIAVRVRSGLICSVRGACKSYGGAIPKCSAEAFARRSVEFLPADMTVALLPLVTAVQELSDTIAGYDREIDKMLERYPETTTLLQVVGVGALTALAFVLTLERADRFSKSRAVGAFVGLVPGSSDTGDRHVPLKITKEGDVLLRRLLVSAAQYILGPFGKSCDLRRHGERMMGSEPLSSKSKGNAKKRAVIAVARKLAVLLHVLWKTGRDYDPAYNSSHASSVVASGEAHLTVLTNQTEVKGIH